MFDLLHMFVHACVVSVPFYYLCFCLHCVASASASDYGYQNQNEDPNQNYQPFSTGSAAHTNSTNTRTAGILQPGKSNLRASTGVHTGVGIGGNTAAANGHVMLGSQVNSILTLKSPTAGASAPTATTNNRVKFNDYAIQEDHDLL